MTVIDEYLFVSPSCNLLAKDLEKLHLKLGLDSYRAGVIGRRAHGNVAENVICKNGKGLKLRSLISDTACLKYISAERQVKSVLFNASHRDNANSL